MIEQMSRWKPGAQGRLEQAAFELFVERGYDQTTVADIAARADLTERTFFRHYADKREVLFGGSILLRDELVRAVESAPPEARAIEVVRLAVGAISRLMHGRRSHARERERIVTAHADLQERGLIKRAKLTLALTDALLERGVPKSEATLAADLGIAVFYIGFGQWLDGPEDRELIEIVHDVFDRLRAIAAET
jgi:AcrR family transcriptional regulator